jgi:hypothetical protein
MSATPTGYRPPQWAQPAMVSITVPAGYGQQSSAVGTEVQSSSPDTPLQLATAAQTSYVFDAVLSLEHNQTLTKTIHPVQNGAAITSHAYLNPPTVVMYVLMSDAVGQYVSSNQTTAPYVQQWTGNASKSVSAYQQILALQSARVPLTITTRLRTYSNMLVMDVSPHEDAKSVTGARFRVEFGQIFLAGVTTTPVSARPNDTNTTGLGAVSTTTPSSTVNNQFAVPATATTNTLTQDSDPVPMPTEVDVPGAGSYSSVPQQFGNGAVPPS